MALVGSASSARLPGPLGFNRVAGILTIVRKERADQMAYLFRPGRMKSPSGSEKVFAVYLGAVLFFLFGVGAYYFSTTMSPEDGKDVFSSIGFGSMVLSSVIFVGMWLCRRFIV